MEIARNHIAGGADMKCVLHIYRIRAASLQLQFTCADVNEQLPIIPNQMDQLHLNLTQRSFTDFSVNIHAIQFEDTAASAYDDTSDIHTIRELKLWKSEGKLLLVIMLSDATVMVYEQVAYFEEKAVEHFRFKLHHSHVLMKPKYESEWLELQGNAERLVVSPDCLVVLHPDRAFTIIVKQGQVLFHNIGRQDFALVSIVSKQSGFLTIDSDRKALKMTKFAFDHRKMPRLADGFLLKPMKKFMDKGIKKMMIFRQTLPYESTMQGIQDDKKYICLATYKHVPPPDMHGNHYGFNGETKAPSSRYMLELF